MKKKLISIVLTLCMVLTLLPTTAYAGVTYGQTEHYNVPTVTAAAYAVDAASPTDYEVSGTAITIKTDKGVAWLTQNSTNWGDTYTITLANDIVVSAFLWSPIGTDSTPFAGTFDGAGHTVSGVYLHNADNMQGLFGKNIGTIQNVGVANSDIACARHVGAIVGYNYAGTVKNCWNSGAVSATGDSCGGIVGRLEYNNSTLHNAYIYNCRNSGTVSGSATSDNIGGIVGLSNNRGYVYNSYNTGAVSGQYSIGGIVGTNYYSDVYNSYNTGAVSGQYNVGGIAGYSVNAGICNSCNIGAVTSTSNTIGICIGGILGRLYNDSAIRIVSRCYYRTDCATDGQSKAQTGIGTETINTAGTDTDGTTNAFTGTGAGCVLSNAAAYTITNSANTSGKSIAAGATLVTALNTWVASTIYNVWTSTADYPVLGALWAQTYTLTIAGGGTGATASGSYASGANVSISAGTKAGFNFNGWTSGSGSFGNASLASTTFTMPAGSVTITAGWTAKTAVSITETAQTFTYNGAAKAFALSGTPNTGYTITYNQGAGDVTPTNAGTYNVVITRVEDTTYASYSRTITAGLVISKASQAAPTPGKTNETVAGAHDGTITGVNNTMEYKLSTAVNYNAIAGTSVTGLPAGTYYVRYTATTNYNAGTDAQVTIEADAAATHALTIEGGGTGATASGSYAAGAVPIHAGTNAGFSFSGWTIVSGSGSFANASLASTTFTMPASAVTIKANWTAKTAVSITETAQTFTYDGTAKAFAISGTPNADFSIVYNQGAGNLAPINTGTYNVVITRSEDATYALYSRTITGGLVIVADSGGDDSYTPSPTNGSTDIIVNGKSQPAGSSATTTEDGRTTTTITVDNTKLEKIFETEGSNTTVTIPSTSGSNVTVGMLNGQSIKIMEEKEAVLEIKTGTVTYTLPASQINIDAVSGLLGDHVQLKDIKVSITIAEPSANTVKTVEDTANKNRLQIVVKPVEFEITCSGGDKTVNVSKFNGYVERTIAIPDGVDPSRITTGIVLNNDGTFSHVPTTIVLIDGKHYAKIKSLTNSTYTVIYNQTQFNDLADHWAKDIISEMGSRLIVDGDQNGDFNPDSHITRAEFSAIIVRALGLTANGTACFSDVSENAWYYEAVGTAFQYGIVDGKGNDKFNPDANITREEAMAMIYRASKLTPFPALLNARNLSAEFSDYGTQSAWADEAVAFNLNNNLINGFDGKVNPNEDITRAEVATVVLRLLQRAGLIDIRTVA